MTLTQKRLQELLDYDCETGVFTWKVGRRGTATAGDVAGCLHSEGYVNIMVDGKIYSAHRLAWLFVHGSFPSNQLDHWNRIRNDNRIANLREVDHRGNSHNRKRHQEGKLVGTSFRKDRGKWRAQIENKGKKKSLGCFDTELEAHEAYMKALKELNESI
jgi:HNH endonuclease/AP2 domain